MPFPLAPSLTPAFTITLELSPPLFLPTPQLGVRHAAVHVRAGVVSGPRLNGHVLPDSGGDWARLRPDGVLELDARYTLEADDGTLITLIAQGYRWGPAELMQAQARGEVIDPADYYMRVTPRFVVGEGPHEWLARHIFVGLGGRTATGNRIDYYTVE